MYRDDSEAARARIESLEAEVQATRHRIGDHERSIGEGCKSRDHLAAMRRVAVLEAKVAKAKSRSNEVNDVPPEQAALQQKIEDLRAELGDLQLLSRGDDAMQEEIAACRTANQSAASEVEMLRDQALVKTPTLDIQFRDASEWGVWVPSALGWIPFFIAGISQLVGIADDMGIVVACFFFATILTLFFPMLRWTSCRAAVRPDGFSWTREDEFLRPIDRGAYSWDRLCDVAFLRTGELHIEFKDEKRFRFRPSQREFPAVVQAVLAEAKRLQLQVSGQPPKLLAADPASPDHQP